MPRGSFINIGFLPPLLQTPLPKAFQDSSKRCPVVIFVAGGAWTIGYLQQWNTHLPCSGHCFSMMMCLLIRLICLFSKVQSVGCAHGETHDWRGCTLSKKRRCAFCMNPPCTLGALMGKKLMIDEGERYRTHRVLGFFQLHDFLNEFSLPSSFFLLPSSRSSLWHRITGIFHKCMCRVW